MMRPRHTKTRFGYDDVELSLVGCFTPLICPGQRGFLRSPKIILQAQRAATPNSA